MYNPEIVKLINRNFEIGFQQKAIYKQMNIPIDPNLQKQFDTLQAEYKSNRKLIEMLNAKGR